MQYDSWALGFLDESTDQGLRFARGAILGPFHQSEGSPSWVEIPGLRAFWTTSASGEFDPPIGQTAPSSAAPAGSSWEALRFPWDPI